MRSILITGGAGFVGSYLAIALKEKYPAYKLYVLDNLKRRGSELNLVRLKEAGVEFVHGDIRSAEDLNQLPALDLIIEASAEPSVLAGITSAPDYLINTNLVGAINCLNLAARNKADFIFLSTSRIYPINQIEKIATFETETRFEISQEQIIQGVGPEGLAEDFPLDGYRSLYGCTKLSAEYFIQEYRQFYGIRTVINRCGLLSGPWQMGKSDQGVVGLWVARHFWKQPLSYIGFGGTGKQTRDVLHVADLFNCIDYQIHHMDQVDGECLNVGGGRETSTSLLELTALCQEITGNKVPIQQVPETRPADIKTFITDSTRIKQMTGWRPVATKEQLITDILNWLRTNENHLKHIL
ncbi:NAD-dependent epimerase/dehydratase family protein [Chitinophaga sp. HK235]|uniref:NAD-dependent epimerase/dehydratase family protein n=1 Tax=Chitinophaga sp. HK235 TaxID=2952571 RepID=UPI001BA72EBC|nr:NAD-dependent epimerase/dehydratase family protein [Chitinophaga sp. HK235]